MTNIKISMIGVGASIVFLPLFSIPAVYKSNFCQGAEIALFYGLPTRHVHRDIRHYYAKVFGIG